MISTDKTVGSQKIVQSLSCGHTLHLEIRTEREIHPGYLEAIIDSPCLCPICMDMTTVTAATKE